MIALFLRNLQRSLPRLRPMIAALVATFALLFLGNSVSQAINSGYEHTYREQLTADGSISPADPIRNFTIFGSEALLVGEYFVPPIFADFPSLAESLDADPGVADYSGLISLTARVEILGKGHTQPVFGVDFDDYRQLLPEFELIEGSYPEKDVPGVIMNRRWAQELGGTEGGVAIGKNILLTVASEDSFSIREFTITGLYEYPASDPTLNRVAIIDADRARELSGYIYGQTQFEIEDVLPGYDDSMLADTDDLFGSADDLFASDDSIPTGDPAVNDTSEEEIDPFDFDSLFDSSDSVDTRSDLSEPSSQTSVRDQTAPEGDEAWNFLLIRLTPGHSMNDLALASQPKDSTDQEIDIRGWRETAGGNALLVWIIQLLFNTGLLFVAAGAAIITVNSLVLSVLERSKEIGTMRALGATRFSVGTLVAAETLSLVIGTGLFGSVLGAIAVGLLNAASFELTNPILSSLFGSQVLRGVISPSLVLQQVVMCLSLGILSVPYPLKKTLGITPVKAMSSQ